MRVLTYSLIGLVGLSAIGVGGYVGVKRWRAHVIDQQKQMVENRIRKFIDTGDYDAAWWALENHAPTEPADSWNTLRLDTLTGRRDLPTLLNDFHQDSDQVLTSEAASLLVARAFLHQEELDTLDRIQSHWTQQTHDTNAWHEIGVDRLLLAGDTEAGLDRLEPLIQNQQTATSALIRRAMVRAQTNVVAALKDLDEACLNSPRSAEARSFRAQVLEQLGDTRMARLDYVAAHLAAPENALWKDQLAEFYRRHQNYDFALETWTSGTLLNAPPYLRLKAAFWARVSVPTAQPNPALPPTSPYGKLASYINQLPDGSFWDNTAFEALAIPPDVASQRQELYWLQILQHLKEGDETAARTLLATRPFRHGVWDIALHRSLTAILHYRADGQFAPASPDANRSFGNTESPHPLVAALIQFQREELVDGKTPTPSASLTSLLKGPNAFSAALLSAGWRQAARSLWQPEDTAEQADYPSWFHFGFAQIKRQDESPQAALDYLEPIAQTPDLQLLQAELLISLNQADAGKRILAPLSETVSSEGLRAAWLLAVDALGGGDFARAESLIQSNPNLSSSLAGAELRGKLAQLQGQDQEAEAIYRQIVDDSAQAQRYLADRAFRGGNFDEAKRLTQRLLEDDPSDLKTLQNLRVIELARQETP